MRNPSAISAIPKMTIAMMSAPVSANPADDVVAAVSLAGGTVTVSVCIPPLELVPVAPMWLEP